IPRNSSGVYSLPQAAFVPNTVISSSAVNSDLSDLGNEITNSIAANGTTAITGQLKASSGNVGAPSYGFSSDTNTGFYLAGTHQIGWAANGILAATFNSDKSVTWQGGATWAGTLGVTGAVTLGSTLNVTGGLTALDSLGVGLNFNVNGFSVLTGK